MPKFRKKPVVIEAFQMTEARRVDNKDWPTWLNKAWNEKRETPGSVYPTIEGTGDGTISIGTLEGVHEVSFGDFIIQGVKGELYPCKPDIFEATYESAEASKTILTFENYKRRDEKKDWRARASNGNIQATSGGQGFENAKDRDDSLQSLIDHIKANAYAFKEIPDEDIG